MGTIKGLQVTECIFKCRSLRGHGDRQQQKSPTKNAEHKKTLKLKQTKSFSCLKIVAYVTMMNAISLFLAFHYADNVQFCDACSCKINCLLPALKKVGVGRNNLYPVNRTKSVLTLACPQTLHHRSAFSVDITLVQESFRNAPLTVLPTAPTPYKVTGFLVLESVC